MTTTAPRSYGVMSVVDGEDGSYLPLTEAMCSIDLIQSHERFDLLLLAGDALLLRPCVHEDGPARGTLPIGHDDLGPDDYCGLVKFVCANPACTSLSLELSEDAWPRGWYDVNILSPELNTERHAAFCSRECAAAFLATDAELPVWQLPGRRAAEPAAQ